MTRITAISPNMSDEDFNRAFSHVVPKIPRGEMAQEEFFRSLEQEMDEAGCIPPDIEDYFGDTP